MKIKHYLPALGLLLFLQEASALPLLAENAASRVSELLTVYPDHQDPNKFYYFPNAAVLSRDSDGKPMFTLVTFGLKDPDPNQGGGVLSAVFNLKSSAEQQKAKNEFLAERPQGGLAVLPVKASTLEAAKLSFMKNIQLPKHGGRAEDEMGIMAELTQAGARVVRAQAQGSAGQQVNYCYIVEGYGPDMNAHIVIEYQRIYDYFQTSYSTGSLWWRKTITAEVEKLKEMNLIRITINGGNAKMDEYVSMIVDMMVKKLFVPSLEYGRSAPSSSFSGFGFNLNLSYVHKEETKRFEGTIVRRDLVEREFCVTMAIRDVKPYFNELVIDAD